MGQSMLSWQGNGRTNTLGDEDLSELMESLEESFSGLQSCAGNCVPSKYITEVHKCRHALNHLRWYMAGNSSNVDLFQVVIPLVLYSAEEASMVPSLTPLNHPLSTVQSLYPH